MLVVRRNDKSLRTPVKKFLASPEKPDGFFVNIHDQPGPFMVGDETIKIEGRSHVKEVVDGVSYLVSPTAFFQTNVGAAADDCREIVLEEGRTAPGPCWICTAAAGCFAAAREVWRQSDGRRREPAGDQGRRVQCAAESDSGRTSAVHCRQGRGRHPPRADTTKAWDAVVLDPPRQGCPARVLSAVFEHLRPAKAVYVSCNPDALAKELPVILKAGYRVTRAQAVDMFPHTNHIETVMAFDRK